MTRTKARRGKCGHTGATFLDRYSDTVRGCHVFHKRCLRCMEQVGMGPAAADTPAVALERDAIEHWMEFVPYDDSGCCCDGCQKRHLANDIIATKDESP